MDRTAANDILAEMQFHPNMTGLESESLVEPLRVLAGNVRGQLDQTAFASTGAVDHPFHQPRPDSEIAQVLPDPHGLDQRPPSNPEPRNKGQLKRANDFGSKRRDYQLVVRMRGDFPERTEIILAGSRLEDECVSLEQFKNRVHISFVGEANLNLGHQAGSSISTNRPGPAFDAFRVP